MSMFGELWHAGLMKQLVGMLIGALLLISGLPFNMPGYIAIVGWIVVMGACVAVYRRGHARTNSPAVLVIPMIVGYVVLVQTTVIAAAGDWTLLSRFSIGSLAGIVVTWCSFCWLLVALEKERSFAKKKNDEKLKNDGKAKNDL